MRATVIGLLVSTALAIVKLAAGILGNSFALIADGVE
jgi:divalent metal cation (Fe/Co/Zn/Cd) transporter